VIRQRYEEKKSPARLRLVLSCGAIARNFGSSTWEKFDPESRHAKTILDALPLS
jgi:hypothetical protein